MSEKSGDTNHQALMKKALLELRELRSKVKSLENARHEPIAIVGMGCRFPGGADDPQAFWQRLQAGYDAITEVPAERWDVGAYYDPTPATPGKLYTRTGSFLAQVDQFDPQFFGISPREAINMDPQQRLLLEVCWEALEQAGYASQRLRGSATGVFVGVTANDYSGLCMQSGDIAELDVYFASGNPFHTMAGRVSYELGLQGPTMALDTACSSSLVAVHLACQSLRLGECDLALAGGVNLILSPEGTIVTCQARMLAPDGRCKTFDAAADGYVRGEGCGVVVLKRLGDAQAAGDTILALLLGSAINHGGASGGFTVPNGPAQQALLRQALQSARVAPEEIQYVEAHGTGTSLGDPIEVGALGAVFGPNRPPGPAATGGLGQDQHRALRSGGGDRWADQGGTGPAPRGASAPSAFSPAQSAYCLGRDAHRGVYGSTALASRSEPTGGRCQLFWGEWHQCSCGSSRSAAVRTGTDRFRATAAPVALGREDGGSPPDFGGTVRSAPEGSSRPAAGRCLFHREYRTPAGPLPRRLGCRKPNAGGGKARGIGRRSGGPDAERGTADQSAQDCFFVYGPRGAIRGNGAPTL